MHRVRLLVLLSGLLSVAGLCLCHAQTVMLDLPRQSQHAVVTQRIGITDITINYHRPLANGRKSGAILCLTERSGAPEPTKIPPSRLAIRSRSRASHLIKEPTGCT